MDSIQYLRLGILKTLEEIKLTKGTPKSVYKALRLIGTSIDQI